MSENPFCSAEVRLPAAAPASQAIYPRVDIEGYVLEYRRSIIFQAAEIPYAQEVVRGHGESKSLGAVLNSPEPVPARTATLSSPFKSYFYFGDFLDIQAQI